MALTHSSFARFLVVLSFFAVAATLSVLAASRYQFRIHATLKAFGVYFLSLGAGICVLIVDELLHRAGT